MFFPKKEKKKEVAEIKEVMDPMPPEPPPPEYIPQVPHDRDFAPLFVKVDKYKETLTTIQEMKIFVSGIKQLFTILHELETVRTDAVKIMRATIQRLERNLLEMDTELLRPKGFELSELRHEDLEVHNIEDSLGDLQKQLASLRKELQDLK